MLTASSLPSFGSRIVEMREFYDYLLHRIKVKFAPKNTDDTKKDPEFDLTLNKRMTYSELAAAVGKHLNVDPTHLRFSQVAVATNRPKQPIRYTTGHTLGQILAPHYAAYGTPTHRPDGLYYEVLECSMAELENRKVIRLIWLQDGQENEEEYELLVPKTGLVTDLIDHLQRKAGFADDVKERVHVFEVHNHKIHKDCPAQFPVVSFNEYAQLYAEPRPQDELRPGKDERLGSAFHFEREVSKSYGHPFQFLIKDVGPRSLRMCSANSVRGKHSARPKVGCLRALGLKSKSWKSSSLPLCLVPAMARPNTWATVSFHGYVMRMLIPATEDILSEALGPDDYLGVDHANKNKPAANRGDQIYIK
jgi:ubiquitin carboxyl-terminal hydrolase 7